MKTNRGMIKTILLSIITFGIYGIVFYSNLSTCRITSLSHGNQNVGRSAAEALICLLEGRPAQSRTIPWVLMEKESS